MRWRVLGLVGLGLFAVAVFDSTRSVRAQSGSTLVGVMELTGFSPTVLVAVDGSGRVFRMSGGGPTWVVDATLPGIPVSLTAAAPNNANKAIIGLANGEVWAVYSNGTTVSIGQYAPNVFGGPVPTRVSTFGSVKARYR